MRIISPFHDYYDNAMAFGQDTTVVYHRVPTVAVETKLAKLSLPWQDEHPKRLGITNDSLRNTRDLVQGILLLAGTPHVVWVPHDYHRNWWEYTSFADTRERHGSADPEDLLGPDERLGRTGWELKKDAYNATLRQFCQRNDLVEIHLHAQAPVVLLFPTPRWGTVQVTNPPLMCFNIHKHIHAFEAFQGISQYIEGVLPRAGAEMAQLSDKEQLVKKGFDPKYSFRKPPQPE